MTDREPRFARWRRVRGAGGVPRRCGHEVIRKALQLSNLTERRWFLGRSWLAPVIVAVLGLCNAMDGAHAGATDGTAGILVRPPAPASLPDVGAIRAWGEKTSWGGHEIDTLKFTGQQAVV